MKAWKIVFILFVPAFLLAQEISFSKDSLNFFFYENVPDAADTLWIKNLDTTELVIDSIISAKSFGYKIQFIFSDTSLISGIPMEFEENIYLPSLDSAMIVFSNPDKCPVCKFNPISEILNDTIFFLSNSKTHNIDSIYSFIDAVVKIENRMLPPSTIELFQNYPNPFNSNTQISFYLPKFEYLTLEVFNPLGQCVYSLKSEKMFSGLHQIFFDGSDLSSGTYFYRIKTGSTNQTKKMLLIK